MMWTHLLYIIKENIIEYTGFSEINLVLSSQTLSNKKGTINCLKKADKHLDVPSDTREKYCSYIAPFKKG